MLSSSASSAPRASSTSPMTTFAPSSRNLRTVASPIPEHPPVIIAVRPSSRGPVIELPSLVLGDEDVLLLGERVRRIRSEFPAEAGLLVAAERRPVPHRGVRIDAQVPGLDRSGDPQCTPDIAREDRTRQPVLGVVGKSD